MGKFILGDCMDLETGLPSYPDKFFDLAIVDPPYGIGAAKNKTIGIGRLSMKYCATSYLIKDWDKSIPDQTYFKELFRVSKNQIICGANYFNHFLPPSRGYVFWDKRIGDNNFSMGEIFFTSFKKPLKIFVGYPGGNRVSNNKSMASQYARIHPTQKPVKLYQWLLENYAKPGQLIVDTHVGSASSLIAFESMGFDYVAWEIGPDYYAAAQNRMSKGIQGVLI